MASGLSRSIGDMGLMIASIRSGTGKVDAQKADPVAADIDQADTENADPTAPEPVDTQQADAQNADPAAAKAVDTEQADNQQVDTENADPTAPEPLDTEQTAPTAPEPVDTQQADAQNADPAAAKAVDTEQADNQQVDTENADPTAPEPLDTEQTVPTAADREGPSTAHTGPDNADTVEMPPVGAVLSGGRHPGPQLPAQQVLEPLPVQNPADKKRFRFLAVAAAILAALFVGAFLFASRGVDGVTTIEPYGYGDRDSDGEQAAE